MESTIDPFIENKKHFNTQLQEFQFLDKYSRYNNEKGRRETWKESVARAVNYLRELGGEKIPESDYKRIESAMLDMGAFCSMRLFAMAGPAARRQNASIYNCSYLPIDSINSFVEVLLLSMSGTGVGYSVESRYINKLPQIPDVDVFQNGSEYVIPDTTEGWCEALRIGLEHWFSGRDISFDYSQIRPAGSVLKTKGGRASGPEPLVKLLDFAREKIKNARGRKLRPIEVHDIVTMIASCAVSGGSRRAAQISLFDFNDGEMLHAKDSGWWKYASQRSNANNSAVWPDRRLNKKEVHDYMMVMHDGGGGEPGIYIRKNAKESSGRRDPTIAYGTNPLIPSGL